MKKKVIISITLIIVLICTVCLFAGCTTTDKPQDTETTPHQHAFSEWTTVREATCTEDGLQERTCECGEKETQSIDKVPHTEAIDAAVSATCTETGLTEGKHCSVCNEVLVKQEEIKENGHTNSEAVVETRVEATCTRYGRYDSVIYCSICSAEVRRDAKVIDKLSHEFFTTGKSPTKTTDGYSTHTCIMCNYSYTDHFSATGSIGLSYVKYGNYYHVAGMGTCTDTEIVIPTYHNGYRVDTICSNAFDYCEGLKSVVILDGVTSIGERAFYGCSGLESITIPDSVTSIGNETFENCSSLESVTIGNGVTSIGFDAFRVCSSLKSITIPGSVTSIGLQAFGYCSSLESVTMGRGVQSIGRMAFTYCDSLVSVTIPDSVTSIDYGAFGHCSSLESVTIPDSVTSIEEFAFAYCSSLESITIPDSVTSIGEDALKNCSSLTSIVIPDSVTSIGDEAFSGCSRLTNIKFDGTVAQWNEITFGGGWKDKVPATQVICSGGIVVLN